MRAITRGCYTLCLGLLAGCGLSSPDFATTQLALERDAGSTRPDGGGSRVFDTCVGTRGAGQGQIKFCDFPVTAGWVPMEGASCGDVFTQCHAIRSANPMSSLSCIWTQEDRTRVLFTQELTPEVCTSSLRPWSLPAQPTHATSAAPDNVCTGTSGVGEYRMKMCSAPRDEGLVYTEAISCAEALTSCRLNQYNNPTESITCNWTQNGRTRALNTIELTEGVCAPYLGAWPVPRPPTDGR